jgi:hypothetical protein
MGNPPIPADPAWLHNPAACGTLCSIANAGPINATLIMTPSPIELGGLNNSSRSVKAGPLYVVG